MEPIRDALIIAADTYGDSKLRALRAPARDAEELARVLGDPEIGDFRVGVSLNEPDHAIRRKLSEFFQERGRDDLLLLHMSCHGLKDEDGNLYFATANTEVEHLEATAIPSEFVNRQMTRSRSRRIVLLLDCCFGGAFARGMVHRAGSGVDVAEKFDGQGRVVLTASRAMEWAFEGDHLEGEARPSIFTSALVQGLESGMADLDQDSRISVDELYEYVYEQVREATPNQTPSKWTFDVQGDLYVARSTYRAEVEPAELPLELRAAIESPFANVRAGAVEELARLLGGAHAGFSAAALVALGQLADDDSRRVSESAARALGEPAEQPEPIAVRVPEPTPPETVSGTEREPVRIWVPSAPAAEPARRESSTSVRLAVTAARARRWGTPLALAGAAALVLGYFLPAKWDESQWWYARNESETWWVWSPIEALGVALLAAAVLLARAAGRFTREAAVDGLLVGLGTLSLVAALALRSHYEPGHASRATVLGALALVAVGTLSALTKRAEEAEWDRVATVAAGLGATLCLVSVFADVTKDGSLWDASYRPIYVEIAAAAVLGALCVALLTRLPRARHLVAGVLIGIGLQLALHFAGVIAAVAHDDIRELRLAAAAGVLSALLFVVAGIRVLRAVEASGAESPARLEPTT